MKTPKPRVPELTVQRAFKAPEQKEWNSLESQSTASADSSDSLKATLKDSSESTLKEMLLTSMQMQHVVVLAGSGCSLSAGCPSMTDLWNAAIGQVPSKPIQEIATQVNHDISKSNIEAFLSKAEAFLQVHEDDANVKTFVKNCKQTIIDKCSIPPDTARLEAHKTFLHRLSRRRARDPRLKIFTTNYDLCFELAGSQLGAVPLDGFSFTAPRHYDPRYFGYDIIRRPSRGDDHGNYLEGVFLLHKLHGSVNWARKEDGRIEETQKNNPDEVCIIYPATGKYQQSFLQPHLESISQYLTALREPNTCLLCVGFGFNDDHLSEPLLAAVESNPHMRLIIVDSRAKEIVKDNRFCQRLSELNNEGSDIWFINALFSQFAMMIPDLKSLTPSEKLSKAVRGVTR